jgi:hypothetical protein
VAPTSLAPQADIRAEAVDQPRIGPARVGMPETDDVADVQLKDYWLVHPGGQGIKAADDR